MHNNARCRTARRTNLLFSGVYAAKPHYRCQFREFSVNFWGHFSGYIDEVRISTVARYNIAKRGFTPRKKFENDAETVALWHFDEPIGARAFSDTSSNAYHLVGKNGARTDGAFAVEAEGKLAVVWGRLKR
ncbi:MAG: hypothetical protein OXU36_23885 [Candidatus Poribacteria bacterium]|nr:hypothetical protein [Candidatus Poribacteria bacterium]